MESKTHRNLDSSRGWLRVPCRGGGSPIAADLLDRSQAYSTRGIRNLVRGDYIPDLADKVIEGANIGFYEDTMSWTGTGRCGNSGILGKAAATNGVDADQIRTEVICKQEFAGWVENDLMRMRTVLPVRNGPRGSVIRELLGDAG